MTADVRAGLRRNPNLSVGVVQDGAPEMWNTVRGGLSQLRRDEVLSRWEEGIDRYHLLERLAAALELVEPSVEQRKHLLDEWNEQFDTQDSTIDTIDQYLNNCYKALPVERQKLLSPKNETHYRNADNDQHQQMQSGPPDRIITRKDRTLR